ncbi:hypothetical protein BUALT_Bualt11G0059200 [Buddleja alternifolia]|uniref:Uncharacterized protein n=1 Tax=Buddleja alternifolia TaxID=168488 RepID=A0AAV6X3I0_9LAMI|nr:hypothetical protein BUALT_Bualt11G0059200 [Buddleja alternifolia]
MEATLLSSSPKLPYKRSPTNLSHRRKNGFMIIKKKLLVNAKQLGHDQNMGESAEENSIVLRLRVKKLKVKENISNQEGERKLFTEQEDFCEKAMELFQSYLMNNRPNLALGMLALAAMSVQLSSPGVVANALKVAKGLLSGFRDESSFP